MSATSLGASGSMYEAASLGCASVGALLPNVAQRQPTRSRGRLRGHGRENVGTKDDACRLGVRLPARPSS